MFLTYGYRPKNAKSVAEKYKFRIYTSCSDISDLTRLSSLI